MYISSSLEWDGWTCSVIANLLLLLWKSYVLRLNGWLNSSVSEILYRNLVHNNENVKFHVCHWCACSRVLFALNCLSHFSHLNILKDFHNESKSVIEQIESFSPFIDSWGAIPWVSHAFYAWLHSISSLKYRCPFAPIFYNPLYKH